MKLQSSNTILISLFFSIVGFIFSLKFQAMAYLGENTMTWYYLGAALSYIFAFIAIFFLVYLKIKNMNIKNNNYALLIYIDILLILATFIWSTFIIIAWQSGF